MGFHSRALGWASFRMTAACALLFAAAAAGGEELLERYVEFRDGSTLRVSLADHEIAWTRIDDTGQIFVEPCRLSELNELQLVVTPVTEQLEQVRGLVNQLGDNDFHRRERAQKQLLSVGDRFRTLLQTIHEKSSDAEVRWRLAEVMRALPPGETSSSRQYDQITRPAGAVHRGDAGRWQVTARYRNHELELTRENVRALRATAGAQQLAAEPEVPGFERLESDEDDAFPQPLTRIDFERGPAGETLTVGNDIGRTFVPLGCTLETSFPNGIVSVQTYNVGGRSGGRCAATHDPIYQGILTIRFCSPGNAEVPAGVKAVGFWTSHIAPDGTALEAYDARDRRLGVIRTVRRTRDWLAVRSTVPIAYIKIVPDPEIDRDYAIDDLTFDVPQPLLDAGDPQWFVVVLRGGERLKFKRFEANEQRVVLEEVSIGLERLELEPGEVAALYPQLVKHRHPADDHCFVMLADGSVVRAEAGESLTLTRFQEAAGREQVAALWGGLQHPGEPAAENWPEGNALLMVPEGGEKTLEQVTLGEKWIESPSLTRQYDFTYHNAPPVWLLPKPKRAEGAGLLRLVGGEELVLSPQGCELLDWTPAGVSLRRGGQEFVIPLDEVVSLLLPQTP